MSENLCPLSATVGVLALIAFVYCLYMCMYLFSFAFKSAILDFKPCLWGKESEKKLDF